MNASDLFVKVILLLINLFVLNSILAQNKNEYDYYIHNSDTVFCMSLSFHVDNEIYSLESLDSLGNKTIVDSIRNNNIQTFSTNRKIFDLITVTKKKKEVTDYYWRKIDGHMVLYNNNYSERIPGSSDYILYTKPPERPEFYVQLENGNIVFIKNTKSIEKFLLPHLVQCDLFKRKYKGKIEMAELETMVKLYNSLCINDKK